MNITDFFETYKPIPNPEHTFLDWEGTTYAWTTMTINKAPEHETQQVWTIFEDEENDVWTIEPGFGWCNALGYIITEKPWVPGETENLEIVYD